MPCDQLDELQHGILVVINLVLEPLTSPWYLHKFVIGEINNSISHLDTTNLEVQISMQIYLSVDRESREKT
jgi:hypothetical protein